MRLENVFGKKKKRNSFPSPFLSSLSARLHFSFPAARSPSPLSFLGRPSSARQPLPLLSPRLSHCQPGPTCRRRPPPPATAVRVHAATALCPLLATWARRPAPGLYKKGVVTPCAPLLPIPAPFSHLLELRKPQQLPQRSPRSTVRPSTRTAIPEPPPSLFCSTVRPLAPLLSPHGLNSMFHGL